MIANYGSITGGAAPMQPGAGIVTTSGITFKNHAGSITGGSASAAYSSGGAGISALESGSAAVLVSNVAGATIQGGAGGTNIAVPGIGGTGLNVEGVEVGIDNADTIEGGQGGGVSGGGGTGGVGVEIFVSNGGVASLTNESGGIIQGGYGGVAGSGDNGGTGIVATNGASITNDAEASILGDSAGVNDVSFNGGLGISASTGVTIDNSGTIAGTGGTNAAGNAINAYDTEINNYAGGVIQAGNGTGTGNTNGGIAIIGTGKTAVVNAGSIIGGSAAGTGAAGDAVFFSGGGNSLDLEVGSSVTGNIVSASGTTHGDSFMLGDNPGGGGSDSINIGTVSGFASYSKTGTSTWTLAGTGSSDQKWSVVDGRLAGDATSIVGDITFNPATGDTATVTFDQGSGNANSTASATYKGVITGDGSVTKTDDGTLILTGANAYSGTTTIDAGTVQVGNNAGTGSIGTGDAVIATGSVLDFDRTGTVTYAGAISGGGTLQQTAAGTLTLNGSSGALAGSTEVKQGTVLVGDASHITAALGGGASVDSGATLGGFGEVGAANKLVEIKQGGILSPGAGTSSIGTLTVADDLTLDQGSVLDFDLGAPDANNPQATPGLSDHVTVDGTLTFDGGSTLNLTNAGSMGPGLYNLASYGSLTTTNCGFGSGTACVTVGSVPAGSQPYNFTVVNNTQSKQVDLYNTAGLTLDIWDPSGNTSQLGGTGTWTTTSPTWTDPAGDGPTPMQPQPGFAIFQGTVTVSNTDGQVSASGLQFSVDGYTLAGDPLTLVGTTSGNTTTAPIIEVGDGSSASAGMTATIDDGLQLADGFTKTGAGTLVFDESQYPGAGSTVQGGTLQLGNGTYGAGFYSAVTMAAGTHLVLDFGGVIGGYGGPAAVGGQGFSISSSGSSLNGIWGGSLGPSAVVGNTVAAAIAGTGFTATFSGNTTIAGASAMTAGQAGAAAITGSGFYVSNASSASTGGGVGSGAGIRGGMGGYSAAGTGGLGGTAMAGSGFTVVNTGGIYGGAGGGTNTGTVGLGGAGVYSTGGSTVINEGTISGGMSGDGATQGDAIDFTGGGNTLELVAGHPGTFNGAIVVTRAAGDSADTLELGGDTGSDTLDLSQMGSGAIYGGFNAGAKTGGSTWTLQGTDTNTATWDVAAGTLVVGDDSHPSTNLGAVVMVAKGATITGIGTVGGLDLSGTLSPGGSIGTFHVDGDTTFEPGSTFQVEASPDGQADQLAATGKVTIKGGNTLVVAQNGNWKPSTDYTIITAGNGVTGTFDAVSDNLAFLDPILTYPGNAVNLELQRNETSFASLAQTPNQRNTAEGVNGAGVGNPLYKAVLLLDPAGARHAFDALSGEIYPTAAGERLEAARYVRLAMNQRLLEAGDDAFGADGKPIKGTAATIWSHAWGRSGHHDGDGNAARDTTNGSGLLVGMDMPVGNAHVGGLVGAAQQSTQVDDRGSSMSRHTTWLGLYGGMAASKAWRVRGGVAYGHDRLESTRYVAFPGYAATVNASPDGHSTQAYIENALHLPINHGALEPYLNLAWTRVSTNGLTEHGGVAALHVAGNSQQATFGTLGVRGMWRFDNQHGSPRLALDAGVGWRHAFSGTTTRDTMNFVGQPQTFTIEGLPIAENAGVLQLGVDMALGKHTDLDLGYRGERGSDVTDQSVHLQLAVNF